MTRFSSLRRKKGCRGKICCYTSGLRYWRLQLPEGGCGDCR